MTDDKDIEQRHQAAKEVARAMRMGAAAELDRLAADDMPDQFLPPEAWSVDQHRTYITSGEKPESPEYQERRKLADRAAGTTPSEEDNPVEDWTPERHLAEIRQRNSN